MKFTKENFPELLKRELKKRNVSRKEFAKMVGVSPKTVENWLYYQTPPGMVGVLEFFNR